MPKICLTINDRPVEVEAGATILEAARSARVNIPTLCHIEGLEPTGSCRICSVEVEGRDNLVPSCAEPAVDGMSVRTNSPRVLTARRYMIQLLLANHPDDCLYCARGGECDLQDLAQDVGIRERAWRRGRHRSHPVDRSSPSVVRDPEKCILCGKCVRVCGEIQGVSAIDHAGRGFDSFVLPAFDDDLASTICVNCGQCVAICPTGALVERNDLARVRHFLSDESLVTVVQTAPAVRAALAWAYGLSGREAEAKMVTALREMGFSYVFDTQYAADLTIMEESAELLSRIREDGPLPLITSCSPGWIKFAEHFYPEHLDKLSTCKSPQQMLGAMVKNYWAETRGISPERIRLVSVMPCTAKKFEAERPEMETSQGRDVDAVITTRELLSAFAEMGLDFAEVDEGEFDAFLGASSGAGAIFGTTGGVAEAALRTVYHLLTGENPGPNDFSAVRGPEGIKEIEITLPEGDSIRGAVVHGLGNARRVMDAVSSGESDYAFVEIMACPGGCVGGGGQPYGADRERTAKLAAELYEIDETRAVRFSHENEEVLRAYRDYLDSPGGAKSHRLLHTTYRPRPRYRAEEDEALIG
ncbi:MAG: NADH-dependent [FeFe] hydrogenase, group A6 [Clostridia bacterium]